MMLSRVDLTHVYRRNGGCGASGFGAPFQEWVQDSLRMFVQII